jgi:hypothetical protein
MANDTLSRIGAVNKDATATDAAQQALFLKVFAGEVMTNFEQQTKILDKHWVRTIASGKSASFPIVGTIAAAYHVPGAEIVGTQVGHNEKIVSIDGLLLSQATIANIDEAMNHFDVSSIYSKEMGIVLANQFDKNVIQEGLLGARAAALITGGAAGTKLIDPKMKMTGDLGTVSAGQATTLAEKANAIANAIFNAAAKLDIQNAPTERYCFLRPTEYYCLIQNTTALNVQWGGAGSYAEGVIPSIAGIKIIKSNNVPYTDLSAASYHGVNAATTVGLVFCPEAIGTVKLMDLSMQSEFQMRFQATLMVARYAMGHGWLRTEGLVELATA